MAKIFPWCQGCCWASSEPHWRCVPGCRFSGTRTTSRRPPPPSRGQSWSWAPPGTPPSWLSLLLKKCGGMMSPLLEMTVRTITEAGNFVLCTTGMSSGSWASQRSFCLFMQRSTMVFFWPEKNCREQPFFRAVRSFLENSMHFSFMDSLRSCLTFNLYVLYLRSSWTVLHIVLQLTLNSLESSLMFLKASSLIAASTLTMKLGVLFMSDLGAWAFLLGVMFFFSSSSQNLLETCWMVHFWMKPPKKSKISLFVLSTCKLPRMQVLFISVKSVLMLGLKFQLGAKEWCWKHMCKQKSCNIDQQFRRNRHSKFDKRQFTAITLYKWNHKQHTQN